MSIGITELVLIVVVAIAVLGGAKGNDAAKTIGRWLRSAKSSLKTVKEELSEGAQPLDGLKEDAKDIISEFKKEG